MQLGLWFQKVILYMVSCFDYPQLGLKRILDQGSNTYDKHLKYLHNFVPFFIAKFFRNVNIQVMVEISKLNNNKKKQKNRKKDDRNALLQGEICFLFWQQLLSASYPPYGFVNYLMDGHLRDRRCPRDLTNAFYKHMETRLSSFEVLKFDLETVIKVSFKR